MRCDWVCTVLTYVWCTYHHTFAMFAILYLDISLVNPDPHVDTVITYASALGVIRLRLEGIKYLVTSAGEYLHYIV